MPTPTVKLRGDKLIVCCGDDECVVIDTSGTQSSGGGGNLPPYDPPFPGGTAVYEPPPRTITQRLRFGRQPNPLDFWSTIAKVEDSMESLSEGEELTVQLLVPHGSRLRLSALRNIAARLKADVEVRLVREQDHGREGT
jgi:hypothetical protein